MLKAGDGLNENVCFKKNSKTNYDSCQAGNTITLAMKQT